MDMFTDQSQAYLIFLAQALFGGSVIS